MLNDRVTSSCEVEFCLGCIVDSNLMALESQLAVSQVVHEGWSCHTPEVELTVSWVLDENLFSYKGQEHFAVINVLQNDTLFSLVLGIFFLNSFILVIFDEQVLLFIYFLNFLLFFLFLFLGIFGFGFLLCSSLESELLLGYCFFFCCLK